jgi:AraC family transcriptional regulator
MRNQSVYLDTLLVRYPIPTYSSSSISSESRLTQCSLREQIADNTMVSATPWYNSFHASRILAFRHGASSVESVGSAAVITVTSSNGGATMISTVTSQTWLLGDTVEPHTVFSEQYWRQLDPDANDHAENFAISRWIGSGDSIQGRATTPSNQCFVGIAIKSTRLRLARGAQTIFEGVMPSGTLYVSSPDNELTAQFNTPFDFLHFRIPLSYFAAHRYGSELRSAMALNDLVLLRNSLAEQLARTLTERNSADDQDFMRCVAQTLAAYISSFEFPKSKSNALPKWRLRKVEDYVKAHFDHRICLADLARVAGLSRMHFAAQFRAATGYRPREYLLHQRIEKAKLLLSKAQMPLAEVALEVGFCTQAHFSTVFKRMTHTTPARWRCDGRGEVHALRRLPTRSGPEISSPERSRIVSVVNPQSPAAALR